MGGWTDEADKTSSLQPATKLPILPILPIPSSPFPPFPIVIIFTS
jgi:hypothetical protein